MERKKCAICEFENNTTIFSLKDVPLKITCSDTIIKKYSDMTFFQCNNCNTIQLQKLIPLDILYSDSHNFTSVGNIWYNYFELFTEKIKNLVNNKNVLEIGCPSGKIANKLDNYNKWFIVEPNKNKNMIFNEKIVFIEKLFDNDFTPLCISNTQSASLCPLHSALEEGVQECNISEKIDIIIHSHLFEHIYSPNEFLKKCNEVLKEDGEMFFGIPDMDFFIENKNTIFLGLFFEHTIFLNKENITYLLNKHHFEIIEIIDYKNHSTLYHCKKNTKNIENRIHPFCITNHYDYFMETVLNYNHYIMKCNNIIQNTNKDVFVFGASYNTQYLFVLGLDLSKIKGILDNCKEKHNKYFYGYDLKILEPTDILKNNNCIVILKNGNYINEIKTQILSINKFTEIII